METPSQNNDVSATLIARIKEGGPISVAEFMDIVSEAYYARGDVFGRDGDFVTAPEISQVFGELVGLWAVTAWHALGQPRDFHLVECGPGRGTLMADVMRTVADIAPKFMHAASIHLVERSPTLRSKQAQTLAAYHPKWHDDLCSLPDDPLIVIANEFLDALPIEQFVRTASGWCERFVDIAEDGFTFQTASLPSPQIGEAFYDAETGSILEKSAAVESVVTDLGLLCVERPAVALIIDYGHTVSSVGETLQAVKKHKYHSVLDQPGAADVTAHVDFAAAAQAARAVGARVHGPVGQGLWLKRLGIDVRKAQLSEGKTTTETNTINTSIERLVAPEHMGELFKVVALGPQSVLALAGFEASADLC